MLEKDIQSKCLKYLKTQVGIWAVKTITTNKGGVPDILACIEGIFVAFEIKREGEKATALQAYNGNEIIKSGGEWYLVNNFEAFKAIINQIRERQLC
jgi:Holliday junction resolvase